MTRTDANREKSREYDRRYQASEKCKANKRRYNKTEKAKAAYRKYDRSPKGQARHDRYEATRIQVRVGKHGRDTIGTYRVRPEMKAELQERLVTFRKKQREERSDARIG